MLASLSVGFETLRANPLRTILSTLGIVIGVAALVAVLSVGDGMERVARQQIAGTTDLQRITVSARLFRIVDDAPFPVTDPIKLSEADADSLAVALGDSVSVNMMVGGSAIVTVRGDTTQRATQVQGLLKPDRRMADSLLLAGRFFAAAESEQGAPVVTINYRLASDVARSRSPRD
ncbi:MAG TPA: ABC transporter permease, partial [Gemmatimonadaceae bacterium]